MVCVRVLRTVEAKVCIWRVDGTIKGVGKGQVVGERLLSDALIVDDVKAYAVLKEAMQRRMTRRIHSHLEQGCEDVGQQLTKVLHPTRTDRDTATSSTISTSIGCRGEGQCSVWKLMSYFPAALYTA